MSNLRITFSALVFVAIFMLCQGAVTASPQETGDAVQSPSSVVSRWLELHRTGQRDEAATLTTGMVDHRAQYSLPSTRDTGVRVEWSLGNRRAAAVVTSSLGAGGENKTVLLFWLVLRDGVWKINKSDEFEGRIVEERLRGFLEAGDVRWHVRRSQLAGEWESDACRPPGGGIACNSRLTLGDDNRYRLVAWGPGGPHEDFDYVLEGRWKLADGCILLTHRDRTYKCRVTWMADNSFTFESADGRVSFRATYRRE